MKKALTVAHIAFDWLVYLLSHLSFRSETIWICIGWHANKEREIFADNAKYFFLYASQHQKNIKTVWIARDNKLASILRKAGYQSYSVHSLQGAYYSLRAKYTIVDAFMVRENWRYAGGTTLIQLWHGKGMKKTGHDSSYSLGGRGRFSEPNLFTHFAKLVASSPHTARLMASTFRAPIEDILVAGLPRNDILFHEIKDAHIDQNQALADAIIQAKKRGIQKIILYAPTFRPDGSNPLDAIDMPALNTTLEKLNYLLLVTLHPKFSSKDIHTDVALRNIHYIPAGFDSYPQLKDIDVLITDYSSLYIDYLLLDRPIIFYTYDLEKYKNDMGLHEDFERFTPGPHVRTEQELLEALPKEDTYQEDRARVRAELFSHIDGDASKRIIESIIGY